MRLSALCKEYGFDRAVLTECVSIEQPQGMLHRQAQGLCLDVKAEYPFAKSILLLMKGYTPYEEEHTEASIDAYYVVSNAAHEQAIRLAKRLNDEDIRAEMTYRIPVKPLVCRAGEGAYGRNGLISVPGFGTRVCFQTIVTELTPETRTSAPGYVLSEECDSCHACERMCPTGALKDGRLDITRCIRAQDETKLLPEEMRSFMGSCILGCDICQRCCPRNRGIGTCAPSDELKEALKLDGLLLNGGHKKLAPFIGSNNARKMRIVNRALTAAENNGRFELLQEYKKREEDSQ